MTGVPMELATTNEDARQIVLPPVLDLTSAAALKQELEDALGKGCGIFIDASAVQRATSPCLQILVAAAKSFGEANGAPMRFVATSAEFRDIVSILGIESVFGFKGLQS